ATALTKALFWLAEQLNDCLIPHKPGQRPDWFSLETVWCKHLSHVHGHYPVGKDICEIRHGLEPWLESSPTAKRFLTAMPPRADHGADFMRWSGRNAAAHCLQAEIPQARETAQ